MLWPRSGTAPNDQSPLRARRFRRIDGVSPSIGHAGKENVQRRARPQDPPVPIRIDERARLVDTGRRKGTGRAAACGETRPASYDARRSSRTHTARGLPSIYLLPAVSLQPARTLLQPCKCRSIDGIHVSLPNSAFQFVAGVISTRHGSATCCTSSRGVPTRPRPPCRSRLRSWPRCCTNDVRDGVLSAGQRSWKA